MILNTIWDLKTAKSIMASGQLLLSDFSMEPLSTSAKNELYLPKWPVAYTCLERGIDYKQRDDG